MLFFAYGCELCHSLFVGGKGFVPDHETAYKTVGETDRKLHIFNPEGHEESDTRPAIVFFFGGLERRLSEPVLSALQVSGISWYGSNGSGSTEMLVKKE
jgi:hypothetical protein